MTKIFYTYLSEENHNRLLQKFLPRFSKELQRDILKYHRWQDKQFSLLGKLLLQFGLKQRKATLNLDNLVYNSYGKPYFDKASIKFNISHSGELVVCAFNDTCDVGIDIEKVTEINISDFRTQMLSSEWERIANSSNKYIAFFEYWTQKEAVIKAHGTGLSIPLKSFEVIDHESYCDGMDFSTIEVLLDKHYKCYVAFKNANHIPTIEAIQIDFSDSL